MLHIWDAVEADFYRDYGILLVERISTLSWRLFLALLNNLSPYGAVAARVSDEQEKKNNEPEDDEAAANAFFSSVVSIK